MHGPGKFRRHVLGCAEVSLVPRADQHQRRDRDRRQRVDHARVALGEYAAGGERQPVRRVALQALGQRDGPVVPLLPRFVAAVARAGVAQHQPGDPVRVRQPELQRQEAAEGQPAGHHALDPARVEQRGHVRHAGGGAVAREILRCVAAAVAAQVPGDDRPGGGERRDVRLPHRRRFGEAMSEQERRGTVRWPEGLVVDADAVSVQISHRAPRGRADSGWGRAPWAGRGSARR